MLVQNSSTRYGPIHYNRIPSVSLILLANSGVGRKGAGNVRQTSVCRWFPPLVHCRKPRQTEVCRTFLNSPTVSARSELVLQTSVSRPAFNLAFSPDGRLLASMDFIAGSIKLWEVSTGRELFLINLGTRSPTA